MSILKISGGADPNYLATIVKCPILKAHPNAERLEIATVFGNDVIVAKGMYNEGELLCYFPVESCISQKFLSWANLLDKAEFNADGKTKGFFNIKNGRVKAISLRSIPSQGFLYKISKLAEYYNVKENVFNVGDIFDIVGDDVLLTKYIRPEKSSTEPNSKKSRVPKWLNNTLGYFPRPIRKSAYTFINAWYNRDSEGIKSQIVDGEFRFHYKTEHLGKNIFILKPDDFITITEKLHGASGIYSNVRCKKSYNPIRSIVNKFGARIPDTEYRFVYSSRQVIKNRRDGKYTEDIWGIIAEELSGKIPENIILYGELVGWSSQNGNIQKNYDYSVTRGNCDFRVYRVVENTENGARELEWYEIEELCYDIDIATVPVHYSGLAKDLFNIDIDDNWRDKFLVELKDKFFNSNCSFCLNDVVNEGIVLRIESSPNKTTLKFKNPLFLLKESSERDNDETNIEEEN